MHARCPHCSQVFSTEKAGRQFCPSCGEEVNVPEAPSGEEAVTAAREPPAGLPPPSSSGRGPTPWERRRELGSVRGFFTQWKETMLRPSAFWSTVQPDGPWLDALVFGWIAWTVGALLLLPVSLPALMELPEVASIEGVTDGVGKLMLYVLPTLLTVLLYPLLAVSQAAFTHLGCLVFGCARNGFGATFRAVTYGLAPACFLGIPCINLIVGLYTQALQIMGLQQLQGTTVGRAIGASLLFPLVLLCCFATMLAGLVMAGRS